MRLPDDSEIALLVTNARHNIQGGTISQRIELASTGNPLEVITPSPPYGAFCT